MDLTKDLICPKCKSKSLHVKRKVTYIYTYKIGSDINPETIDETESLPFLFDNREKSKADEFVICDNCKATFPIDLDKKDAKIDFTILRKAIRADHVENPEFLG